MTDDRRERFAALDGFRGVCALAVVFCHIQFATSILPNSVIQQTYLCVDFFFVLSGFVISYAYNQRLNSIKEVNNFIVRRFGRLWPLNVATIIMLVIIEFGKFLAFDRTGMPVVAETPFTGTHSIYSLVANVLLVQSFAAGQPLTWNYPSWSISAEFIAYLVFAAVWLFARKWTNAAAVVIAFGSFCLIARFSHSGMDLVYRLSVARACLGFFIGHLAYTLYTSSTPRSLGFKWGSAAELGILAFAIFYMGNVDGTWLGFFAPIVFSVVILVFSQTEGAVTCLLNTRPAQYLGKISYSIYLMQLVLITLAEQAARIAEHVFHYRLYFPATVVLPDLSPRYWSDVELLVIGNAWITNLVTFLFFCALIGVSGLTYKYIEQPGRRYFADLSSRSPAAVKAA